MPRRRVFTSRRGVISPQHVTSPSRILIRLLAGGEGGQNDHRNDQSTSVESSPESAKHHRNDQSESSAESSTPNGRSSTDYLPVMKTSSHRPSPYKRSTERSYERSVERAVATEPRTNRRRDTSKPSGRRRACVERTTAMLAIPRHAAGPAPRIDDTHASGQTVTSGTYPSERERVSLSQRV